MSRAITSAAVNGDVNVLIAQKNWWPRYKRNVFEWSSGKNYLEGDFVRSKRVDWSDKETNHLNAEEIVWRCLLPMFCQEHGPASFFPSTKSALIANW